MVLFGVDRLHEYRQFCRSGAKIALSERRRRLSVSGDERRRALRDFPAREQNLGP
jgi:hypothetical protein